MERKKDEQNPAIVEATSNRADEPADAQAPPTIRQPALNEGETSYLLVADPFEIASNTKANVRLLEYRGTGHDYPYFRIISFPNGEPTEGIRDYMKTHGVQWNKPMGSKSWNVVSHYPTRSQDRIHAERVFRKVVDMILEEKGLARESSLERS